MNFGAWHNPFSVQHIGPGNISTIFEEPSGLDALMARLEQARRHAELTGPEGVGKSTLLRTIAGELDARGTATLALRLQEDSPRLPWFWWRGVRAGAVVLLDGAELLPRARHGAMARWLQRRGCGLITTLHEPRGFGELIPVIVSEAVFARLVGRLSPGHAYRAGEVLRAQGGNAREALFQLYDEFEREAAGVQSPA